MMCIYLLLLVAASHAYVPRVAREVNEIPTPTLISLTAVDPPGFVLEWTPVQSLDNSDPIVGYKVNVWEQPKKKVYHFENINGENKLVEDYVPSKFSSGNKIPQTKPKEIIVVEADKSSAKVEHIEVGVAYEARVQAFTKSADGPFSQPMMLQLLPKDKDTPTKDMYIVS